MERFANPLTPIPLLDRQSDLPLLRYALKRSRAVFRRLRNAVLSKHDQGHISCLDIWRK